MNVPANQAVNPDARPATVDIDSLDVSAEWKRYFQGHEKIRRPQFAATEGRLGQCHAGGKKIIRKEVQPPILSFLLAFIFCFFYYLAKGMWKKGLVMLAALLPPTLILAFVFAAFLPEWTTRIPSLLFSVIFAFMAPRDFYAKKVEGDGGWMPRLR